MENLESLIDEQIGLNKGANLFDEYFDKLNSVFAFSFLND